MIYKFCSKLILIDLKNKQNCQLEIYKYDYGEAIW